MSRTYLFSRLGAGWKKDQGGREHMGRMRAKIALRFPMEMEAQGLGQWDPFSLPSPETDRQTDRRGWAQRGQ